MPADGPLRVAEGGGNSILLPSGSSADLVTMYLPVIRFTLRTQ
ncbi:MAG: hypothetical protein R2867_38480 [Caldilineaceae bacterium]